MRKILTHNIPVYSHVETGRKVWDGRAFTPHIFLILLRHARAKVSSLCSVHHLSTSSIEILYIMLYSLYKS